MAAQRVIVLLFLLNLSLLCRAQQTGTQCGTVKGKETETCLCQVPNKNGVVIDLRPISRTDGTPRFSNLLDPNQWQYEYNPCKSYTSSACNGAVYGCQTSESFPDLAFTIAEVGSEEMWVDTDDTPYLFYTGPGNNGEPKARQTKVFFHCDTTKVEPEATAQGDSKGPNLHYVIDVFTKEACEKEQSSTSSGGVAPGEIGIALMVLTIVSLGAYFVIGALVMALHYKRSGSEIVPNKNFWVQFPLLIKDGFVFTFGPCYGFIREKTMGAKGYQKPT